jgi:hypothetical protein
VRRAGESDVNTWTTVIRFLDVTTGETKTIENVDELSNDMVVRLAMLGAAFEYEGKRAIGGRPLVNPVTRTIVYDIELFPSR